MAEICETVLYRKQGVVGAKLAPRWDKAIWLGKLHSIDEHMLGLPSGRETARSVTGRPDSKRWSKTLFARIVCTPWTPKASLDAPEPEQRQTYLTKALLDKYGRTPGCAVCQGQTYGMHSAACRARLEARLAEDALALPGAGPADAPPAAVAVEAPAATAEASAAPTATAASAGGDQPMQEVRRPSPAEALEGGEDIEMPADELTDQQPSAMTASSSSGGTSEAPLS